MPEPLRRVSVITGYGGEGAAFALAELAAARGALGVELFMPSSEAARYDTAQREGYDVIDDADLASTDLCLVFGGDGTILRALGRLLDTGVPTLGVNFGKVGFLASLPRKGWIGGLAAMIGGDYRVVDLLTVDVQVNGRQVTAVNDVTLSRVAPRHVLQLQYEVAGVTAGSMFCDGLIVASPQAQAPTASPVAAQS